MRKTFTLLTAVILAPVAVAVLLLARPAVDVASSVDPDVTIRCDGSTSVTPDACLEWGDQMLSNGAPSRTFEMEDLVRLELGRPMLGFAATCQVTYFLQRYPEDPAWGEEGECVEG